MLRGFEQGFAQVSILVSVLSLWVLRLWLWGYPLFLVFPSTLSGFSFELIIYS